MLSTAVKSTLSTVAEATFAGQGFMFLNMKSPMARILIKDEYIGNDPSVTDPNVPEKSKTWALEKALIEFPHLANAQQRSNVVDEASSTNTVDATGPSQVGNGDAAFDASATNQQETIAMSQTTAFQPPRTFAPPPVFGQPAPTVAPAAPGAPVIFGQPQAATAPAFAQEPAPVKAKRGRGGSRGPRVQPEILAAQGGRFAQIPAGIQRTRGHAGGANETYPFSTLQPPNADGLDSFYVKATALMPDPFKTLRASVGSANKRFKDRGIEFVVRDMGMTDYQFSGIPGARVFRAK